MTKPSTDERLATIEANQGHIMQGLRDIQATLKEIANHTLRIESLEKWRNKLRDRFWRTVGGILVVVIAGVILHFVLNQ